MKPGLENKEEAMEVLGVIEYFQKHNTTDGLTSIASLRNFNIDFGTFYAAVHDMQNAFEGEIGIVNIYDPINEEHWMNPPMPGYPEHRPIAELRLTGPVGRLRSLVESEYKDMENDKIKIIIDKKNGLYMKSHPERSYDLQYKTKNIVTKRFRLIKKLVTKKGTVGGPELRGALGYDTVSLVSQEIKKINDGCRDQAGLFDDLILHLKTGGYQINPRYRISYR